ncbi:MAG: hypothetical protein P0111_11300 [Nitrospira sp.]|nr:hypothetical protein [Nitrospira sp.]
MSYNTSAELLLLGLFVGMVLCLLIGQRLGRRDRAQNSDSTITRLTAVEAAIFGLMGLMIAFTFSGAADRFELRRQLVVEEANTIGTSYLRLDLLPAARQPALRDQYRRYLEARIGVIQALPDLEASGKQAAIATGVQREIWSGTVAALGEMDRELTDLVLSPVNAMIDVATRRSIAAQTHTPKLIMTMLLLLSLSCSLLAGYVLSGTQARHVRLHLLVFALVMTVTIFLIVDLDYPRYGLIKVDFADQALLDVLAGMK